MTLVCGCQVATTAAAGGEEERVTSAVSSWVFMFTSQFKRNAAHGGGGSISPRVPCMRVPIRLGFLSVYSTLLIISPVGPSEGGGSWSLPVNDAEVP